MSARTSRSPISPTSQPRRVGDLALDLRRRGVVLSTAGRNALRWRAPAGVITEADLAILRERKTDFLQLLADLASLEADGTAEVWRDLFERLSERDRKRLAREVAEGDVIACRLALSLDLRVTRTIAPNRGAA
jgi:hypothetical protein